MRDEDMERLKALRDGDDKAVLEAVGQALYGERWQRPLAAALDLTGSYLSRIMSEGDRSLVVSDSLKGKLHKFLGEEWPRREAAHELASAVVKTARTRFREDSS